QLGQESGGKCMMLITLEQASDHLRRDTGDDDADLLLKIEAASQAVLNYITDKSFLEDGHVVYDSAGEPVVPRPIQAAALIVLGQLYKDRDGEEMEERSDPRLGDIVLPRTVHFLLDPYKTPVVG